MEDRWLGIYVTHMRVRLIQSDRICCHAACKYVRVQNNMCIQNMKYSQLGIYVAASVVCISFLRNLPACAARICLHIKDA